MAQDMAEGVAARKVALAATGSVCPAETASCASKIVLLDVPVLVLAPPDVPPPPQAASSAPALIATASNARDVVRVVLIIKILICLGILGIQSVAANG
jgi:hypothetical protein